MNSTTLSDFGLFCAALAERRNLDPLAAVARDAAELRRLARRYDGICVRQCNGYHEQLSEERDEKVGATIRRNARNILAKYNLVLQSNGFGDPRGYVLKFEEGRDTPEWKGARDMGGNAYVPE